MTARGSHVSADPAPRLATSLIAAALLVAAGCASREAPWDVPRGDETRFRETSRVCRLLTDDRAGELDPERFEKCMNRRGWKRQGFLKRLFHRD